jgi:hypothetical protein
MCVTPIFLAYDEATSGTAEAMCGIGEATNGKAEAMNKIGEATSGISELTSGTGESHWKVILKATMHFL